MPVEMAKAFCGPVVRAAVSRSEVKNDQWAGVMPKAWREGLYGKAKRKGLDEGMVRVLVGGWGKEGVIGKRGLSLLVGMVE